jgi:hypothetical protein
VLLLGVALAAGPLNAQATNVQVDVSLPNERVQCAASEVALAIGDPTTFAWRCNGAAARFRCTLTQSAQTHLMTRIVAATCDHLTELPPRQRLIVASGFEPPQP